MSLIRLPRMMDKPTGTSTLQSTMQVDTRCCCQRGPALCRSMNIGCLLARQLLNRYKPREGVAIIVSVLEAWVRVLCNYGWHPVGGTTIQPRRGGFTVVVGSSGSPRESGAV